MPLKFLPWIKDACRAGLDRPGPRSIRRAEVRGCLLAPPISSAGRRIESGWPQVVQNLGPSGTSAPQLRQRRPVLIVNGPLMRPINVTDRTVPTRMPFVLFMVVGPALLRAV
jgi:hypothetical protein